MITFSFEQIYSDETIKQTMPIFINRETNTKDRLNKSLDERPAVCDVSLDRTYAYSSSEESLNQSFSAPVSLRNTGLNQSLKVPLRNSGLNQSFLSSRL